MNKKGFVVGILLAFILIIPATNFTKAQVPYVPPPSCVPGLGKCPNESVITPTHEKQPLTVSKTGDSQTFNGVLKPLNDWLKDITKIINATVNQINIIIVGALSTFFDNAKDFFRKIKF